MSLQSHADMSSCECRKENHVETGVVSDAAQTERLAGIFKALGHPVRLRLALMLLEGERCVCELHAGSERDISTISSHLSILKNSGVLTSEQRGKNIFYRLCCPCLGDLIRCLSDV